MVVSVLFETKASGTDSGLSVRDPFLGSFSRPGFISLLRTVKRWRLPGRMQFLEIKHTALWAPGHRCPEKLPRRWSAF